MYRRLCVWLRLLAAGAVLYASSPSGCLANALRDAADTFDDTPQNLEDVDDIGDFFDWLDNQVDDD